MTFLIKKIFLETWKLIKTNGLYRILLYFWNFQKGIAQTKKVILQKLF